jgi:hypothetical protein
MVNIPHIKMVMTGGMVYGIVLPTLLEMWKSENYA